MKASFDPQFDSQFNSLPGDSAALAYCAQGGVDLGARGVCGEPHAPRGARAGHGDTGAAQPGTQPDGPAGHLFRSADSDLLRDMDRHVSIPGRGGGANRRCGAGNRGHTNHFVVVLLWFVPVTFAVLAAIWYRRWRTNAEQRGASR